MLHSKNLSLVLSQVLKPIPQITESTPISISLLSLTTEQALFSCFPSQTEFAEQQQLKKHTDRTNTATDNNGNDDNNGDYEEDYINANINPYDNLKIISLLSIKSWKERLLQQQQDSNWLIIQSNDFYMTLYKVNEEYLLLLCCELSYPKGLSVKRLEKLSIALNEKL